MTHLSITKLGPSVRITRVGGSVVSRQRPEVLISRRVYGDKGNSGIVVSDTPPADHTVLWLDTTETAP